MNVLRPDTKNNFSRVVKLKAHLKIPSHRRTNCSLLGLIKSDNADLTPLSWSLYLYRDEAFLSYYKTQEILMKI